jgi:hypothetical protein
MAAKHPSIKLSYPHLTRDPKLDIANSTEEQRWVYLVLQVKNSTAFSPGTYLTKQTVTGLCASEEWDVTLVGAGD